MKFITLLALFVTVSISPLFASSATTRPVPQIRKALIISIDGLRPDVLLRADAPRIRSLIGRGAFSFWARSTASSITLPTHVSMLTGVIPEAHAILWNGDLPLAQPVYPRVPTIFELAKKAGYSTACVAGKSKFDIINKPGTIDHGFLPDEAKCDNANVMRHTIELLEKYQPDVMFVHLPEVDSVGHSKGWGTPEQIKSIADADACVGRVLDTLAALKLDDETLIILTSDHGGAGRTHGADDFRSRHIPWIVVGPGIRRNYDLTMNRDLVIEVYDTFTMVCTMLDIPIGRKVNGKFVEDVLAERELVKPDAPSNYLPATTKPVGSL